ncbi:MAG: GTPase Era [Oscillospiraceae bacterium]|nr:GTPase Era [Oscillospiraceae bacterium]MBR4692883.1 GTPase Era [Oscillospiraceae bacterium]
MNITKTGVFTIAGRPNVGKSTLANRIAGEKIAIVSHKPQTTRNRITAICCREDTQLVFLDTPGYHKPKNALDSYLDRIVETSVADQMDAVILMAEPIPNVGKQEEALIRMIRASGAPAILAVNKCDTVKKPELLAVIGAYAAAGDFAEIIPISAKTGEGVEELLHVLMGYAQPGPQLFPEDMVTDQPDRQIVGEIVREKLLYCLEHEIPHGTAVEVERFSERDSGVIDLEVTIYCEKASHKSIIIGKNGSMLKRIGELARKDVERYMGTKVFLQSWVKVKENWRDQDAMLRNFGYHE